MASNFPFILMVLLSLGMIRTQAQSIRSARLLDLLIRDYTFMSYDLHFRTGSIHPVKLPSNFSGIRVDSARFRCGSLRRYGARVKEFSLGIGVTVQPCAERVMVIVQNLGRNWSDIYYSNYDLSGYQIVSPILGLLAYNADSSMNSSSHFEVGIQAIENPITIDFTNTTTIPVSDTTKDTSGIRPECATFEADGKFTLKNPISPFVCHASRQGHYSLVIKSRMAPPPAPSLQAVSKSGMSIWKVAIGSSIGAMMGFVLLGLLLVAMLVKVKKKARMVEMERRAYEEEALQVSMVGHVRAPIAIVTRTPPTLEHEYY